MLLQRLDTFRWVYRDVFLCNADTAYPVPASPVDLVLEIHLDWTHVAARTVAAMPSLVLDDCSGLAYLACLVSPKAWLVPSALSADPLLNMDELNLADPLVHW